MQTSDSTTTSELNNEAALPLRHLLVAVWVLCFALPAAALDVGQKVQVHAFGTWAFGDTDGNEYLFGGEKGEYDNIQFSPAFIAEPLDNLILSGQVSIEQSEGESEVEIDYAFALWEFSDRLGFQIGKVKQPFGNYSEVSDVGTLRPFLALPQGVYGPLGLGGESYSGLGFTGSHYPEGGWEIHWDAYVGELEFETESLLPFEVEPGMNLEPSTKQVTDALGGRFVLMTPVNGLSLGLSVYHGTSEREEVEATDEHLVAGVNVEYTTEKWWLRGEYVVLEEEELQVDSAYLEIARMLTSHWQIAARFDWADASLGAEEGTVLPSLLEHEDLVLGLNYWFSTNLVLKLEFHQVQGNLFALPEAEEFAEAVATGELEDETNSILFGAQFSF